MWLNWNISVGVLTCWNVLFVVSWCVWIIPCGIFIQISIHPCNSFILSCIHIHDVTACFSHYGHVFLCVARVFNHCTSLKQALQGNLSVILIFTLHVSDCSFSLLNALLAALSYVALFISLFVFSAAATTSGGLGIIISFKLVSINDRDTKRKGETENETVWSTRLNIWRLFQ